MSNKFDKQSEGLRAGFAITNCPLVSRRVVSDLQPLSLPCTATAYAAAAVIAAVETRFSVHKKINIRTTEQLLNVYKYIPLTR